MDLHVFPIPIPPPASLPIPSLWVFPVHQPWAPVSYIQPGLVILIVYLFQCCSLRTSHPRHLLWNFRISQCLSAMNASISYSTPDAEALGTEYKPNSMLKHTTGVWYGENRVCVNLPDEVYDCLNLLNNLMIPQRLFHGFFFLLIPPDLSSAASNFVSCFTNKIKIIERNLSSHQYISPPTWICSQNYGFSSVTVDE